MSCRITRLVRDTRVGARASEAAASPDRSSDVNWQDGQEHTHSRSSLQEVLPRPNKLELNQCELLVPGAEAPAE